MHGPAWSLFFFLASGSLGRGFQKESAKIPEFLPSYQTLGKQKLSFFAGGEESCTGAEGRPTHPCAVWRYEYLFRTNKDR